MVAITMSSTSTVDRLLPSQLVRFTNRNLLVKSKGKQVEDKKCKFQLKPKNSPSKRKIFSRTTTNKSSTNKIKIKLIEILSISKKAGVLENQNSLRRKNMLIVTNLESPTTKKNVIRQS